MSRAPHRLHYVSNDEGWLLELKQCKTPARLDKNRRPVVIVPGYGMNSFIFGYHPSGLSMESYLRRKGLEVWSVNLRSQGGSQCVGGSRNFGMWEFGAVDLKVAVEYIAQESRSEAGKVDLIGCSLGGTLSFIYAATDRRHRIGSLVAIGSPLRWEKAHPLLRLAASSPRLIGMIPVIGAKEIIRGAFPKLIRSPFVKLYMHPEMIDLKDIGTLLETVEDPNRHLNREVAEWIIHKDLVLRGKNISAEFKGFKNPLLCVLANSDGIVPPLTALSPLELAQSRVKETLMVGTDELHFAHADLFISRHSHDLVFKPMADWLLAQYKKICL